MTSRRCLRKGAQQVIFECVFRKGDHNFISAFDNNHMSNHMSIMHHFRYNQVLSSAGNDVIVLSPQRALQVNNKGGFWKGNHDFMLVFKNNHTSIMHRFRYNQLLLLAGSNVIVWPPQGVAASEV